MQKSLNWAKKFELLFKCCKNIQPEKFYPKNFAMGNFGRGWGKLYFEGKSLFKEKSPHCMCSYPIEGSWGFQGTFSGKRGIFTHFPLFEPYAADCDRVSAIGVCVESCE